MSDWDAILGSGKPAAAPPLAAAPAPAPAIAAQPGADPWHGVLGPGATPAAAPVTPSVTPSQPAGAVAPAANPAAEPGGDWLPGSVWLRHMSRVFDKALTSGTADYLGNLPGTGTNVAAERAKTAAAGAAIGPVASGAADLAGYAMGPGKILGPLSGGSAVGEGLMAGAANTLGQGDTNPLDIAKSAGEGALGGKLGQTIGKYGGAIVRGAASKPGFGGDPAAVTAAAEQAKTDAYSVYNNVHYSPTDIAQGVDDVKSSIYPPGHDPTLPMNSPQTVNLLNKFFGDTNAAAQATNSAQALSTVTGSSLNDIIKKFGDIARKNPTNFEGVAAAQARDGLTDLFHTASPITAPPGFDAATAETTAKLAHSQFKNAEALEDWQREINKYGGNVGNDVKAYNEKWYGDNTPQDPALMGIYNAQQQSGAVPRWATSILHEGIGAAAGEGAGHMAGLPPGIGAGLGMAATYGVGKPLLKAGRALSQGIDTQQAFDQAYPAMTGRNLTPIDTASFADALRRLGITQGINR